MLFLAVAGCGRESHPQVVRLARQPGFVQLAGPRSGTDWRAEELGNGWLRVHQKLGPESVKSTPWADIYTAPTSFPAPGPACGELARSELLCDGEPFDFVDVDTQRPDPTALPPRSFAVACFQVYVKLEPGQDPSSCEWVYS